MENLEIVQESPMIQRRQRGRPRIFPAKEIDPDTPKRGRGRPRIFPAKEVNPDEPKKERGRLRKAKSSQYCRARFSQGQTQPNPGPRKGPWAPQGQKMVVFK